MCAAVLLQVCDYQLFEQASRTGVEMEKARQMALVAVWAALLATASE